MSQSTVSGNTRVLILTGVFLITLASGGMPADTSPPCSFVPNSEDETGSYLAYNRMMARYVSLDIERSEEILTYSGSTLWDYMMDVVVCDSIMYALDVNGLRIFDISDITGPVLIKDIYLDFGSVVNMMIRDGDLLYVGRANRLHIFDITNRIDPEELSVTILGGTVMEVQVLGDRAYAGIIRSSDEYMEDSPGLYILDVSDPGSPSVVGKYEGQAGFCHEARRFVVSGSYIYSVNAWDSRLEVISIEDETRPCYVKSVSVTYPLCVARRGGYLYISGDRLTVVDITDPDSPVTVGSYDIVYGKSVAVHNDKLFVMEFYDPDIRAYGFTGAWELTALGIHRARGSSFTMRFQDSYMFVPEGRWGMTIADVSNPWNMPRVGEFSHACSDLNGIDVRGSVAYATNWMSYGSGDTSMSRNGIFIVDVSDKANPEFVKHVRIAGNTTDAYVHDTLLLISQCPWTNIYSLSNPLNPQFIGRYPPVEYRYTHANCAQGTTMYASCSGYGFETVSIADPTNPVMLANVKGDGVSRATRYSIVRRDIAYVFDNVSEGAQPGLHIMAVDVGDPADPEILDDVWLTGGSRGWGISFEGIDRGNYLYVGTGGYGLCTIDISNPRKPDVVGYYDAGLQAYASYGCSAYKRDYLFVTGHNSIEVLRIADPANPSIVQFVPLSSRPGKIVVDGDYLYAGCEGGFFVFKITLPPISCGDADASGAVDIDDIVFLVGYIFSGGPAPDPWESGDVDCSGGIDIDDVVYLVMYVFAGGPAPCAECP